MAIVGPIPPYSNVVINTQFYEPSRFVISAISLGKTTTITTTENMNYVIGQLIRLLIPSTFGSIQLNNRIGYVISIPASNQVEIDIDSSIGINAFISSSAKTKAQIVSIGDINSGTISSNGRISNINYIPGSFINIS